ncbi:uncharacterized protein [Musca autumnalis]|uniref:uncharacterized protein n=1 Tax=Musca autumnalis TaxID=221902 RepID=UPI003CF9DB87
MSFPLTNPNKESARAACKKCGYAGHLTFQCRNFLKVDPNKEILLDVESTSSDSELEYLTPLTELRMKELKEKEAEILKKSTTTKSKSSKTKKSKKKKTHKHKSKKKRIKSKKHKKRASSSESSSSSLSTSSSSDSSTESDSTDNEESSTTESDENGRKLKKKGKYKRKAASETPKF